MLEDELEVLVSSKIEHQKTIIRHRKCLESISSNKNRNWTEMTDAQKQKETRKDKVISDFFKHYNECFTLFGTSFSWLLGNLKDSFGTESPEIKSLKRVIKSFDRNSNSKDKDQNQNKKAIHNKNDSKNNNSNNNSKNSKELTKRGQEEETESDHDKTRNFIAEYDIFVACSKAQIAARAMIDIPSSIRLSEMVGDNWSYIKTMIHPWNYSTRAISSSSQSIKHSLQSCSSELKLVTLLNSMSGLLQDSIFKATGKSGNGSSSIEIDHNKKIKGPLTWKQFVKIGCNSTNLNSSYLDYGYGLDKDRNRNGQNKEEEPDIRPLPIPHIVAKQSNVSQHHLFNSKKIHDLPQLAFSGSIKQFFNMSQEISVNALSHWAKLGLQPNTQKQDVVYVCFYLKNIEEQAQNFMAEVSSIYENSKLGQHRPLMKYDKIDENSNEITQKNMAFFPIDKISDYHTEKRQNANQYLVHEIYSTKTQFGKFCDFLMDNFVADCSLATGGLYQSNFNNNNSPEYYENMPTDPYIVDEFKNQKPPIIMCYLIELGYNGDPHMRCPGNHSVHQDTEMKKSASMLGLINIVQSWIEIFKSKLREKNPNPNPSNNPNFKQENNLINLCELQVVPLTIVHQTSSKQHDLRTSVAFNSYNKAISKFKEFDRRFLDISSSAGPHGFTSCLNQKENNISKERALKLSLAEKQTPIFQCYLPGHLVSDCWYDPRLHIGEDPELINKLNEEIEALEKQSSHNHSALQHQQTTTSTTSNNYNKMIKAYHTKTLFVSYCLSHDQSYLLVTCIDNFGSMMDSNLINVSVDFDYSDCKAKLSARKIAIKKLWNYVISIISQTSVEWNICVTRLGRLGHGEMKEWLCYLNKGAIRESNRQLFDVARGYMDGYGSKYGLGCL